MDLTQISNILWRERQLLELLVFKLNVEQLVLGAGRPQWRIHATREVEAVVAELQRVELERAVAVQSWAGTPVPEVTPSLRSLCASVPGPWGGVFEEHRRELLVLVEEIRAVSGGESALTAPSDASSSERDGVSSSAVDDAPAVAAGEGIGEVDDETGDEAVSESGSACSASETIEVIVEALRSIGEVTAQPTDRARLSDAPWVAPSENRDDLARAVVDLELQEIEKDDRSGAKTRALQRSLVEFLG